MDPSTDPCHRPYRAPFDELVAGHQIDPQPFGIMQSALANGGGCDSAHHAQFGLSWGGCAVSYAVLLSAGTERGCDSSAGCPRSVQAAVAAPPEQIFKVGGDVSAPVAIYRLLPDFPDGDWKAYSKGFDSLVVGFVVNEKGLPINVHVIQGVSKGLDKKAVEAVEQWRFKPAMKDDKPVAVTLDIIFSNQ